MHDSFERFLYRPVYRVKISCKINIDRVELHVVLAHHGNFAPILDVGCRALVRLRLFCLDDLAGHQFLSGILVHPCGVAK